MTNTSNPPLEIKHDQIDPTVLEALRKIDEVARKHETSYFLAGARNHSQARFWSAAWRPDLGCRLRYCGARLGSFQDAFRGARNFGESSGALVNVAFSPPVLHVRRCNPVVPFYST